MRDLWLELRIELAFWWALNADPRSPKAQKRFDRMSDLIRRRSYRQVRRMEVRKGLI